MNLWRHADKWDAPPEADAVTLGEGNTPLIRSQRIGPSLGLDRLWFKHEGGNPTGSYKDRFAAVAVTHLARERRPACLGTSSGNTGAALAAYCARAGIPCYLAIVEGAPEGKLRQMIAYGARLFRIKGFGKSPTLTMEVMEGLRGFAQELGVGFEISSFGFSPRGMAGVETIGLELAESFPRDSFHVFSPAGGGGLTLAVTRGIKRWGAPGHVHCVQPAGNDTIASALRNGAARASAVQSTTTISGLQVGGVLDGHDVIAACRSSGGTGHAIADEAALKWQARLALEEGIFSEPAGAVALAGVEQALGRGEIRRGENVVCLVTGTGFKDEASLHKMTSASPTPLLDSFGDFMGAVRGELGRVRGTAAGNSA